jgi:arylsulfatase A
MVHNTSKGAYAVRDGDWVLVDAKTGAARQPPAAWRQKHNVPDYDGQKVGLYNLREDLGQRRNLAEIHPDKVAALQVVLKKIRDQGHSAPRLSERASASSEK